MLVEAAKAAGADAADAIYHCNASQDVSVRLGALEDVQRSESEDVSLRVFIGRRTASVGSSDMAEATLKGLVDRAIAMAREAPEDQWAGLAPADRLMGGRPADLDIADDSEPAPAELRARALEAEEAARGVMGVTNSEGGGASHGRAQMALATSDGFVGAYAGTHHSTWASVLAGSAEAGMQRDHASHVTRHLHDLEQAEAIGIRAGQRAVARLNPVRIESAAMPVIFDPRVGSSLIGHLVGAIVGPVITRGSSFLLECCGRRILPEGIDIIDDPRRARGLRSRPFDGEGLATAEHAIIRDGVLTGWLLDSASARQLGLEPTGHATRGGSPGAGVTNVHLAGGEAGVGDLVGSVTRGLYVTELIGHGVNVVTGDYSRGAAGFLIENGATGPAVAEVTIAGNLRDMFANLVAASDLQFRYAVNVPTLRIDGMTVAGA